MRLSDVIGGIREKVHDEDSDQWSDARVTFWINSVQRSLYLDLAEADPTYMQIPLELSASDATQLNSGIFRYLLPSWVHRVTMFRETEAGTGDPRNNPIRPIADDKFRCNGWSFVGNRAIELRGVTAAKDVTLWVTKPPAPLCKGTLEPGGSSSSTQLVFDAVISPPVDSASSPYALELTENGYTGAVFECVTPGFYGQIVRCSSSLFDNASTGFAVVDIEPSLTGNPSGAFEMHPEIDDQYLELLMLKVAERLFHKTANVDGVAALQPAIRQEMARFMEAIRPRQHQEPFKLRPEGDFEVGTFEDANKDASW